MRGGVRTPRTPWKPAPEDEPEVRYAGGRKKGAWLRLWLTVKSSGLAEVLETGKHSIMRRTGIPARDLRVLDPLLSYPSTVLGRERAIVVNLEHIKAVITADEVLLLNYRDPLVECFVDELKRRLRHRHNRLQGSAQDQKEEGTGGNADWENVYDLVEPCSRASSRRYDNNSVDLHASLEADDNERGSVKSIVVNSDVPKFLPFEFVALEACLQGACSCLENEATILEKDAHPALDKLTSKVSTDNLERVRQIKSRLVAITGRVQKVRDELEHLLDDDDDMAELYLTDKLMQQNLSKRSHSHSPSEQEDLEVERLPVEVSSEGDDVNDDIQDNSHRLLFASNFAGGDSPETHSCSSRSGTKHVDVQELEMLLEAYFVQIDSTLNKLSTLREYVDDTEDYINILLDDKQNQLLQVGVVLSTATLVVTAFVVLVGIMGMNIHIGLFSKVGKAGMTDWSWTVGGGTAGCVFLYILSIVWCKHRRLLE